MDLDGCNSCEAALCLIRPLAHQSQICLFRLEWLFPVSSRTFTSPRSIIVTNKTTKAFKIASTAAIL